MEEEMITLCNIMPVELALKRELEYRKKMEASRNQHQNDLKPLVLAQGPPIQAGKQETEAVASSSQKSPMLQFSSSCQSLQEKPAFSCKACQLTFPTVFHLSSHFVGQEHTVNASEMKKRREAISNPIWCELCRSSCSSLSEMEHHLNGSRHNSLKSASGMQAPASETSFIDRKRKLQPPSDQCSQPPLSSTSHQSSARFVCVVCRVAFATVFHLKMHGETLAHRTKVSTTRKGGANISNPFLCEICDCLCSSGRVMEFHVAGLKHAACLQEIEDAKRVRIL